MYSNVPMETSWGSVFNVIKKHSYFASCVTKRAFSTILSNVHFITMADNACRTDIFYTNIPYGKTVAFATVEAGYKKYSADFLRVLQHLHRESVDNGSSSYPVTATELRYINDNKQFVVNDVCCFSTEVQSFEFLDSVSLSCDRIKETSKPILVFLQRFGLTNGLTCYYFLGTRFTSDIELQIHNATEASSFQVDMSTLRPLDRVVEDLRASNANSSPVHLTDSCKVDGENSPKPMQHDASYSARITKLILAPPTSSIISVSKFQANGFIFCNDLSPMLGVTTTADTFREQITFAAARRLEYYKYPSVHLTPFVVMMLSTSCAATDETEFNLEHLVILAIVILMHDQFEFILDRELRLMTLRVEHQLTSESARTTFLRANDLYEAFEHHQVDCQHDKTRCFILFILSAYEETLRRMRKSAHYLMYGIDESKLRDSDHQTIAILTWLVQQLSISLRDIFSDAKQ